MEMLGPERVVPRTLVHARVDVVAAGVHTVCLISAGRDTG